MNEELRRDLDRFAEENEEAIFRDIARLVAINSVEGEPEEGAPFGPGPKAALEKGLEIARELGLQAVNCADKIGYAQLGEGPEDRYLAGPTIPSPCGSGKAGSSAAAFWTTRAPACCASTPSST